MKFKIKTLFLALLTFSLSVGQLHAEIPESNSQSSNYLLPSIGIASTGLLVLTGATTWANTSEHCKELPGVMIAFLFGLALVDGGSYSFSEQIDPFTSKKTAQLLGSHALAEARAILANSDAASSLSLADITNHMGFDPGLSQADKNLILANLIIDANKLVSRESKMPQSLDDVEILAKRLRIKEELPENGATANLSRNLIAVYFMARANT